MTADANGTIIASSNILADDFKLRAGGTLAQLAQQQQADIAQLMTLVQQQQTIIDSMQANITALQLGKQDKQELVCPSSLGYKVTSNGFEWCYHTTWIKYADAVTLCASYGLRIIEPSSAAKADAMLAAVQAGQMPGNSPWIGLRCRSESHACDHDPSLWSWDSNDHSTATTVNRFVLSSGLIFGTSDGNSEYCAHWCGASHQWCPAPCTISHGYQVACELG